MNQHIHFYNQAVRSVSEQLCAENPFYKGHELRMCDAIEQRMVDVVKSSKDTAVQTWRLQVVPGVYVVPTKHEVLEDGHHYWFDVFYVPVATQSSLGREMVRLI